MRGCVPAALTRAGRLRRERARGVDLRSERGAARRGARTGGARGVGPGVLHRARCDSRSAQARNHAALRRCASRRVLTSTRARVGTSCRRLLCGFACTDWGKADEAKGETKMWEDDWDDAGTKDDFSQQLRAALKAGTK